jgi:lipopolysaccharide export LptBFGC system permease protein LptF
VPRLKVVIRKLPTFLHIYQHFVAFDQGGIDPDQTLTGNYRNADTGRKATRLSRSKRACIWLFAFRFSLFAFSFSLLAFRQVHYGLKVSGGR